MAPLLQMFAAGSIKRIAAWVRQCVVCGIEFRKPPLKMVFLEINHLVSLGYTGLWIADDCSTLDREYLEAS